MRIVFDLDGVICELKKPTESYADVIPKKCIIEKMKNLKKEELFDHGNQYRGIERFY